MALGIKKAYVLGAEGCDAANRDSVQDACVGVIELLG